MLPRSLRLDAWWLGDQLTVADLTDDGKPDTPSQLTGSSMLWALIAAICLVGLADILIFGHSIGLGLVLFTALAGGVGLALRHRQLSATGHEVWAAIALGLGLLPVLEYFQFLSLMFFVLGNVIFVALLTGGSAPLWQKIQKTGAFWLIRIWRDGSKIRHDLSLSDLSRPHWKRYASSLVLPAGAGIVFAMLFLSANPVLEALAARLHPLALFSQLSVSRLLFWGGVLILVWPLLRFVDIQKSERQEHVVLGDLRSRLAPFLSLSAVRKMLILSNLLFLIQGGTDVGYLFAGAELPPGLTYAQYAHRGAYPLLATALLAGGIATMTAGFARRDKWVRLLTVFWMVQTLLLVGTSVFRLSLYVDAYGLTLLRIWAAIWMVLVFAGICLVLIQTWQSRSALWLIKWNLGISIVTLYLCCFFNFTDFVSSYNFRHLDAGEAIEYACTLGDHAAQSYFSTFGLSKPNTCFNSTLLSIGKDDWREWSFRNARMDQSLSNVIDAMKELRPETFEWRYSAQ